MATERRELVVPDSLPRDATRIIEVLASRFGVHSEHVDTVRSVWLDTFDSRLHRAGFALREVRCAKDGEVLLESLTGDVIASERAQVSWPSLIDAFPESSLRDLLQPLLGARALLPLVEVRSRNTALRLVDAREKLVVRVTVEDGHVIAPRGTALPLRIGLRALRGYERDLDQAVQLLCALSGVEVAVRGSRDCALAACGVEPGRYTGKVAVVLDGFAPAARSAATVLLSLADMIEANVEGVVGDVDVEFLHDMRIGVRQTRVTLKAVSATLPAGFAASFVDEWRWLGSATTPVRDLDVFLLGLAGRSEVFDVEGLTGLGPLRDHLARLRRTRARHLRAGLTSPRFAALLREWRARLEQVQRLAPGELSTSELAARRVRRAHRRLLRDASAITAQSTTEELHDVRKRCKELRYVLEVFASLYAPGDSHRVIRQLKALQDCLGTIQDSQVHRDALRAFAQGGPAGALPADTLLAVGALGDRLQTRDRHARAELEDRVARFAGAKTTALVHSMTQAADA